MNFFTLNLSHSLRDIEISPSRGSKEGAKGMHGDLSVVRYTLILCTLLVSVLVGCTTLSPLEAECLDNETLEWYTQCRKLFSHQGVVWYQDAKGFTPRDRRTGVPRHRVDQEWEIKVNGCPIRWISACGVN